MHISTRKYLEDIKKAENRGYMRGRNEAYEKIDRDRVEARHREELERLGRYVEEMKMEKDRREKALKETADV